MYIDQIITSKNIAVEIINHPQICESVLVFLDKFMFKTDFKRNCDNNWVVQTGVKSASTYVTLIFIGPVLVINAAGKKEVF